MKNTATLSLLFLSLGVVTSTWASDKIQITSMALSESEVKITSTSPGLASTLYEVLRSAHEINDQTYGQTRYSTNRRGDHKYYVKNRTNVEVISALMKSDGKATAQLRINASEIKLNHSLNTIVLERVAADNLHSILRSTQGLRREPIVSRGRVIGELQFADSNYQGKGKISCQKAVYSFESRISNRAATCTLVGE